MLDSGIFIDPRNRFVFLCNNIRILKIVFSSLTKKERNKRRYSLRPQEVLELLVVTRRTNCDESVPNQESEDKVKVKTRTILETVETSSKYYRLLQVKAKQTRIAYLVRLSSSPSLRLKMEGHCSTQTYYFKKMIYTKGRAELAYGAIIALFSNLALTKA